MNIKNMRKKKRITQASLGDKLKVSQGAVSQWEKGITTPRPNKLLEMAEIFNCSIEELLKEAV